MHREVDLAYMAGLMDGEGYIGIGHKNRQGHYRAFIQIANTDYNIMDWMNFMFGGTVYTQFRKDDKHSDRYTISFNFDDGVELLKSLLPYMRIKLSQAKLMIEYYTLKGERGVDREEYYFRMKRMNSMKVSR